MRLLADENFPLPTKRHCARLGNGVDWARTDAPGAKDAALLDAAEQEGRILLTLDKDFWKVAAQR
jgi:predicted nuclease of predicted toxin-antitoxin system